MPIHEQECSNCGNIFDEVVMLKDLDIPIYCKLCGSLTRRNFTAPNVMKEFQPYKSMVDGTIIESREQHKKHLKYHGKEEIGNTSAETLAKMDRANRKYEAEKAEKKQDKELTKVVSKAVYDRLT